MTISTESSMEQVLDDFRTRFQSHERARKLTKGWDRMILVDPTDTENQFVMVIENESMPEVRSLSADEKGDEMVHLQGEEEVLKDIFSGRYNPATALIDGSLAVFSSDKDKVKLEALAMVIWRIG
jgi:hypothetical protein